MSEWKQRPHLYVGDGVTDLLGAEACMCGLPKANRLHRLPITDAAVKEAEARRLGERTEETC